MKRQALVRSTIVVALQLGHLASGASGPPIVRIPAEPKPNEPAAQPGEPERRDEAPHEAAPAPASAPAPDAVPLPPADGGLPGSVAPAESPTATSNAAPAPPPARLVQRPEDATAKIVVPAAPAPPPTSVTSPASAQGTPGVAAKAAKIEYVPGFRYILSSHQDNYFATTLVGNRQVVKFQFSFKFDLWPNSTPHSVYFGFSQKSLWSLWDFQNSSAFIDSNYAPELFYGYYRKEGEIKPQPGQVTWTWVYTAGVGVLHESNGDGGLASRSWNRVYATARGGAYFGTDHYVTFTPRIWAPPFSVDEYNPDIVDYLGYGTLTAEYGYDPIQRAWWGGGHVGATVSKGGLRGFSRVSVESFLQWRPAYEGRFVAWFKFTPYLYLQVRRGYADTLLTYDKEETAVRFGFALEDRVNWVTVRR